MAPSNLRPAYASLVLALAAAACDTSGPAPTRASGADAGVAPQPSATVSLPSASSSAATPAGGNERAGHWTAPYQATRAAVTVPVGLPDHTWKLDDGRTATGEGRIEVTIASDGTARGKLAGALGELVLSGMMDGSTLRAGLSPADPLVLPAMGGLLLVTAEGSSLVGELRVSSHDGALVRAAVVRLARQDASTP